MSCYVKHPDIPQIECWHSPNHAGDHNKEGRSWPNLKDPLRIEIARLADEVERLRFRNEQLELACETFEQASALSLADALKAEEELERLRAELATETACHLSNLATMNKESVEYRSENGRLRISAAEWGDIATSQAESIATLRAERAEVLALLESWNIGGRPVEGTRALVAKLRGAP